MNTIINNKIISLKYAYSSSRYSLKYARTHPIIYGNLNNNKYIERYCHVMSSRPCFKHQNRNNNIKNDKHTANSSDANIYNKLLKHNNILSLYLPQYYYHQHQHYQQYRNIYISSKLFEQASSKVEVTVQNLKNKQKQKQEEDLKKQELIPTATATSASSVPESTVKPVVKKSLKTRIWEEMVHYYHGFRLLFIDIYICRKLLWRVITGKKLTRRESRLLVRTTSDLFRLLPFSIFIVVPFLEFFLPIFIKFFPGMLPSTFQTAKDREDKLKQSLQVKLEVAKFLQKTLHEMNVQHVDHKSEDAKEFSEFFRMIKDPNAIISSEDIIKFSKQFEDEVTLDSLSRGQLIALCRILELNTIGTTNFLRFLLKLKLRSLATDDKVIQREGVDALNMIELQQACKARGMRAYGLSKEKLQKQLQEWIDLSLNEKVPQTLLLLSRALMVPDETSTTDKLKATISSLPDNIGIQTKAAIGEREGKIDNKTKIEVIKEEVRKIKEEREEETEIEKEKIKEEIREKTEVLIDKAPVFKDPAFVEKKTESDVISSKDVEVLEEALETLSKDKKTLILEKETIKDLKEEIEEYKEDVEELQEITKSDTTKRVSETRAAKILFKKVDSMINNLDKVLTDLEQKEKKLREDIQTVAETEKEVYNEKKDQLVRVDELVNVIKQLRNVSDESKLNTIEKVLSKIDDDKDGQIKVDDVIKVIEAIGKDNVNLTNKQFEELIELLDKEEIIEAEEKIEKALAKSKETTTKQDKEELLDTAPVITDGAIELDITPSDKKKDQTNDQSALEDVLKSTVEKQKEVLSKTTTTDIPPTIPQTPKQTNPKDKML